MHSRARWLEHGEKSTKYFLSLEKRNHTRKHIRKLCLSGVITTSYDFRNAFSDINYAHYVIWNNKEIRIDNKSIFYKKYADCGILYLNDLLFSLDNVRSFEYLKNAGLDSNFLTWSALWLSVPKDRLSSFPPVEFDPMTFKYNNTEFNTHSSKSKQFYSLLIANKAKYPNRFKTLSADLEISDPLQEVFSIPYNAAGETYVWSFQYKLLRGDFT